MIQEQIERRRKRGREDLKRIVNQGNHPIYSVFAVTSTSGQTYRVRIHDLKELHNTCTCPDYRTNLIGTCKHIEGVLIQLRQKHEDKLEELAAERPSVTRIYLHYARNVTVRVSHPLPEQPDLRQLLDRYFDTEGILQGPVLHTLPALLHEIDSLPAEQGNLLHVTDPVRDHLELLRDRKTIRKQKEWFVEQVRQGNRSLNVLNTRLYPYQKEGVMHLAFGRRFHETPYSVEREGKIYNRMIDLLVEQNGRWLVIDFKTDRLRQEEIAHSPKVEHYQQQVQEYCTAVSQLLGMDVQGNLWFLDVDGQVQSLPVSLPSSSNDQVPVSDK